MSYILSVTLLIVTLIYTVHLQMWHSIRGHIKLSTLSICPFVRPSRASNFLETGKPQDF